MYLDVETEIFTQNFLAERFLLDKGDRCPTHPMSGEREPADTRK
jgi:hypothetical protein